MPPRRPWTPQLGAQDDPGATQEAPKMRQELLKSCPRGVQEATHRRLGAKTRHKAAPDSLQTSILNILPRFGRILGSFWMDFWKDFLTNWIHTPPLLRGAHGGGNTALRRKRYLELCVFQNCSMEFFLIRLTPS